MPHGPIFKNQWYKYITEGISSVICLGFVFVFPGASLVDGQCWEDGTWCGGSCLCSWWVYIRKHLSSIPFSVSLLSSVFLSVASTYSLSISHIFSFCPFFTLCLSLPFSLGFFMILFCHISCSHTLSSLIPSNSSFSVFHVFCFHSLKIYWALIKRCLCFVILLLSAIGAEYSATCSAERLQSALTQIGQVRGPSAAAEKILQDLEIKVIEKTAKQEVQQSNKDTDNIDTDTETENGSEDKNPESETKNHVTSEYADDDVSSEEYLITWLYMISNTYTLDQYLPWMSSM